jgi:hypothetical protein
MELEDGEILLMVRQMPRHESLIPARQLVQRGLRSRRVPGRGGRLRCRVQAPGDTEASGGVRPQTTKEAPPRRVLIQAVLKVRMMHGNALEGK